MKGLEQEPKVKEWITRADSRRERVTQQVLKDFIGQRHRQMAGGSSFSWNNYAHEYWTTFRDLETIYASPGKQRGHLQPLIDLEGFAPEKELHYRLRLGIDEAEKAEEWLARITNERSSSLEERRERDAALVKEFTRNDSTKFERVRRLELLPEIISIFRVEDLDWAPSFLSNTKKEIGRHVHTFKFERILDKDYPEAWGAYADLEVRHAVLDNLEKYAATVESPIERDEFGRRLRLMHLTEWVGLFEDAPERLIRLGMALDDGSDGEEVSYVDEHLGWALFWIISGVKRFNRPLQEATQDKVRAWAARLLHKKLVDERAYRSDAFNAATHLAWLTALDDAARDEVVKAALAKAAERPAESTRRGLELKARVGVWTSLVEAGASPSNSAMAEAAAQLWKLMDERWEETSRFIEMNAHHAWPFVAFLVEMIASRSIAPIPLARERLLQVTRDAPRSLFICAKILNPAHWEQHWSTFVDQVWETSGGGNSTDPVAARTGAVALLRQWLALAAPEDELNPDVGFLMDTTLLALLDESHIVANRAAFNVVGYAPRVRAPADVRRVAGALRRMARDPRLVVRGAAAYGAAKLRFVTVADEVRAVAEEIDKAMSQETYAMIHRQRCFGELDGKQPST